MGLARERCGANAYNELMPTLLEANGTSGNNKPMVLTSYSIDEKMGNTYCHRETGNTLSARDYKQPQAVVSGKEPILLESNQNHATIQTEGVSTTLPASMGMGGGYVPMLAYEEHSQGFPLGFRAENTKLYDEKSTTLCNGTRPGYTQGVITTSHGGFMINADDSDVAHTLQATDYKDAQAVCY
jgi:hypothetical protein